jgi:hypothetical protein
MEEWPMAETMVDLDTLTPPALRAEIIRLRVENMALRQRIADTHNFDLKAIRDQIDDVFTAWLPKVRKANRDALRPVPSAGVADG